MNRGDSQIFSKANLETGFKEGPVLTCSKEKLDQKWLVQCILMFSNFFLVW
jgi:hypothetical protein